MNRGSWKRSCIESDAGRRFNEAPIHESGKFQSKLRIVQGACASMRPRFMNRGSCYRMRTAIAAWLGFNEAPIHESGKWRPILPSGRPTTCFNEAPIHESGKCQRCDDWHEEHPKASMRPRFMNRGSFDCVAAGHGVLSASMRPRFMNRGSLLVRCPESFHGQVASMRPRFMNRGSRIRASYVSAYVRLQ